MVVGEGWSALTWAFILILLCALPAFAHDPDLYWIGAEWGSQDRHTTKQYYELTIRGPMAWFGMGRAGVNAVARWGTANRRFRGLDRVTHARVPDATSRPLQVSTGSCLPPAQVGWENGGG